MPDVRGGIVDMSRVLGLVAALTLGVAACGGGSGDDVGATDPPTSAPSSAASTPPTASDTAMEAASDLSDFGCAAGKDGAWDASGVITNSTGKPADYRVTVVVAEGPGVSVPGMRRTLTDLTPGRPEPFEIEGLPASGAADATCQVEVLRLP
jgi:hypothetical protein